MWSWVSLCFAQTAPSADLTASPEVPEAALPATVDFVSALEGRDVVLVVAHDGALSVPEQASGAEAVEAWLAAQIQAVPDTRVVIQAEPGAPYDAVTAAIGLSGRLGAGSALAQTELWKPGGGLFTGEVDAVPIGEGLSRAERRALRPKRHRFPQDPYQNTSPYTAYTLEWGESRIGLGAISTGIFPRVQLGTVPVLDVIGAPNVQAKINLTREGPLDVAVTGQYYFLPVGDVLTTLGAGSLLEGAGGLSETARASYLGLGAGASLQLLDPWSIHTQVYWARPSAKGEISFDSLPELLLPGLSLGGSAAVGLGVSGDLFILNAATDLRLNRRDSLYLWMRWPFYGRVRGITSGSIGGFEGLANADFMVAYGDTIPMATSLSMAGGYQVSFKHVDARVGLGWSAVPYTWLMQAFEISYKFGGATRREESEIRRGFRRAPDEAGTGS